MPPVGRGRGRGSTMPAWMTHPDGPGGLQESGNGSGAGDRGGHRCDTFHDSMVPLSRATYVP